MVVDEDNVRSPVAWKRAICKVIIMRKENEEPISSAYVSICLSVCLCLTRTHAHVRARARMHARTNTHTHTRTHTRTHTHTHTAPEGSTNIHYASIHTCSPTLSRHRDKTWSKGQHGKGARGQLLLEAKSRGRRCQSTSHLRAFCCIC